MSTQANDLPAPGSIAAAVDLSARLRVFDFDGSLAGAAREVWDIIKPDISTVSEAYWNQWLRCFADERVWAPHETAKMIDLGVAFLERRFLDTSGRAWVESVERSVAAAYVADVSPMALLSMINASDRSALDVLMARVDRNAARLPILIDTLMRLSALEGEVTVATYNEYRRHAAQVARDRLAADFRNGITATVEDATRAASRRRG